MRSCENVFGTFLQFRYQYQPRILEGWALMTNGITSLACMHCHQCLSDCNRMYVFALSQVQVR